MRRGRRAPAGPRRTCSGTSAIGRPLALLLALAAAPRCGGEAPAPAQAFVEAGAPLARAGGLRRLLAASGDGGRAAAWTGRPSSIMDRINEAGLKVCERNPDNPQCTTFSNKAEANAPAAAPAAPAKLPVAQAPALPGPPQPPAAPEDHGWVRAQVDPEDRARADRGELLRSQRKDPQWQQAWVPARVAPNTQLPEARQAWVPAEVAPEDRARANRAAAPAAPAAAAPPPPAAAAPPGPPPPPHTLLVPPPRRAPLPPMVPPAPPAGGGAVPQVLEPFGSGQAYPDFFLRSGAGDPWNLLR